MRRWIDELCGVLPVQAPEHGGRHPAQSDEMTIEIRKIIEAYLETDVGHALVAVAQQFTAAIDPQAVRRQVVSQSDLPPHLRRTGLETGPFYRRR